MFARHARVGFKKFEEITLKLGSFNEVTIILLPHTCLPVKSPEKSSTWSRLSSYSDYALILRHLKPWSEKARSVKSTETLRRSRRISSKCMPKSKCYYFYVPIIHLSMVCYPIWDVASSAASCALDSYSIMGASLRGAATGASSVNGQCHELQGLHPNNVKE